MLKRKSFPEAFGNETKRNEATVGGLAVCIFGPAVLMTSRYTSTKVRWQCSLSTPNEELSLFTAVPAGRS